MRSQRLQDIIEEIKKDSVAKPNRLLRNIRTIVKQFSQYSTTSDRLPPETLIPTCLFILPAKFAQILNLEQGEMLQSEPQRTGLRLCLRLYLTSFLRLLQQSSQEIRHVIVQGMSNCMKIVSGFSRICRSWIRKLVQLWSTGNQNMNLSLRCFICLRSLMSGCNEETFMWSLRRIYVAFFQNSKQVSWRNMQHINFMINCICQWVGLREERAYYVMFGYLRSLGLQLEKLNKLKRKEKVQQINRLYGWQTINTFRMFSNLASRGQMTGLIYPLTELLVNYSRVSESQQYLPLKLHILQCLLKIMEGTGVFIPQAIELWERMIGNGVLQKKVGKKGQIEGNIEIGYRLSKDELMNTNMLNQIFQKIMFYGYWLNQLVLPYPAGPQISAKIAKKVRQIEFGYSGYREGCKKLIKLIEDDVSTLFSKRAKQMLSIVEEKNINKIEKIFKKSKLNLKEIYEQMKSERQQMMRTRLLAENEQSNQQSEQEKNHEEASEVEDGWQEASEGASEFEGEGKQQKSDQSDELEDVSYEGDPEDGSQHAKQWSEHQWSSQQLGAQ